MASEEIEYGSDLRNRVGCTEVPIIVQIQQIKFPALQLIHLHGNQLVSVEGLSRVEMPCLK